MLTGSGIKSRKGDASRAAKGPPVRDDRLHSGITKRSGRKESGCLHTQATSFRSRITSSTSSSLSIIEDPRENLRPGRKMFGAERLHSLTRSCPQRPSGYHSCERQESMRGCAPAIHRSFTEDGTHLGSDKTQGFESAAGCYPPPPRLLIFTSLTGCRTTAIAVGVRSTAKHLPYRLSSPAPTSLRQPGGCVASRDFLLCANACTSA